jgi:hypothetical protein
MTDGLMQTMEARFHGRPEAMPRHMSPQNPQVLDVAKRLREMW